MRKHIFYIAAFILLLNLTSLFKIQVVENPKDRIVTETLKVAGANIIVMSQLKNYRICELLHLKNKLAEMPSPKICTTYE